MKKNNIKQIKLAMLVGFFGIIFSCTPFSFLSLAEPSIPVEPDLGEVDFPAGMFLIKHTVTGVTKTQEGVKDDSPSSVFFPNITGVVTISNFPSKRLGMAGDFFHTFTTDINTTKDSKNFMVAKSPSAIDSAFNVSNTVVEQGVPVWITNKDGRALLVSAEETTPNILHIVAHATGKKVSSIILGKSSKINGVYLNSASNESGISFITALAGDLDGGRMEFTHETQRIPETKYGLFFFKSNSRGVVQAFPKDDEQVIKSTTTTPVIYDIYIPETIEDKNPFTCESLAAVDTPLDPNTCTYGNDVSPNPDNTNLILNKNREYRVVYIFGALSDGNNISDPYIASLYVELDPGTHLPADEKSMQLDKISKNFFDMTGTARKFDVLNQEVYLGANLMFRHTDTGSALVVFGKQDREIVITAMLWSQDVKTLLIRDAINTDPLHIETINLETDTKNYSKFSRRSTSNTLIFGYKRGAIGAEEAYIKKLHIGSNRFKVFDDGATPTTGDEKAKEFSIGINAAKQSVKSQIGTEETLLDIVY